MNVTRRGALVVMAGSGAVLVTDTLGFSRTEVNRITDISAVEDEDAYLALEGIDELGDDVNDCGVVNEFTITNQLGEEATITLSSDEFAFDPHTFDLDETDSETVTVSVNEDESGEIEIEAITDPASIEATVTREAAIEDWSEPSDEEPDNYADVLNDMDGDGSESTPYVITDDQELQAVAGALEAHYELGRNIDASETHQWHGGDGFDPIGDEDDPFTGSFDGNGCEICGITIDRSDEVGVGVFGTMIDGKLENVYVTHVDITGLGNVGALVGATGVTDEGGEEGEVLGAHAWGSVTGQYSVGGLIGYNHDYQPVEDSSAAVDVDTDEFDDDEGEEYVGGLVGYNSGNVIDSHATGTVEGPNAVGGLVGLNYGSGEVINSYATGTVGANNDAGGLVGYNSTEGEGVGEITGSYATGAVTADHTVGGLVGFSEGEVDDSHAEGDVTAEDVHPDDDYSAAGGLVGYNSGEGDVGTITESHVTGDATIVGESVVGGLVGLNFNGDEDDDDVGVIDSAYVTADVTVEGYHPEESAAGGLVGVNGDSAEITGSYAECFVTGERIVGGLVGANLAEESGFLGLGGTNQGEVYKSHATGNVDATTDVVGGFVGSNGGIVEDSYATGSVTGRDSVGGFVGSNLAEGSGLLGLGGDNPGEIAESYATGEVEGNNADVDEDDAGGIGGFVGSNGGVVEDTYARGDVTGDQRVGGLAGLNRAEDSFLGAGEQEGEIHRSYATGSVTGDISVGGVVGENEDAGAFDSPGVVEGSYWDTKSTGQEDGIGAGEDDVDVTGLETDEMRGATAEENMGDDLDFEEVWRTVEDPDNYPELQWQDT